jgi:histidyl-tRNA synthetase
MERTDVFATNDISGFIEHSLSVMRVLESVKLDISNVYKKYGFLPFETRLVEDSNVLKEKGIDSKELFSLNFLSKGNVHEPSETRRILTLRFDLTVPLARYIGQHYNHISFPFKRYQIQKVYRAEQANISSSRFNEFYQSDIDVIGQDSIDLNYDSELPAVICDIFKTVFKLEKFVIRISNRKFLEGLFRFYGLNKVDKIKKAIKVIDNIEKVDLDTTISALDDLGIPLDKGKQILELFNKIYSLTPSEAIKAVKEYQFTGNILLKGIEELEIVVDGCIANGVDEKYFKIDPRIARGLDYYTGTVYETILLDYPEWGSVCSGGRYEDLVGTLSGDKNLKFPGVGISIGLSRLVPNLIMNGLLNPKDYLPTTILVTCQDKKYISKYRDIGRMLRDAGLNVEVFLQKNKKLAYQLEYADKHGFKYVLIGNKYEFNDDNINIRDMKTKENLTIPIANLVDFFFNKY